MALSILASSKVILLMGLPGRAAHKGMSLDRNVEAQ